MQTAFHQQLTLTLADQRHTFRRGVVAVNGIDNLKTSDVVTMLRRDRGDLLFRTDKDRPDQPALSRFHRTAQ